MADKTEFPESLKPSTLAQFIISQFLSSSPMWGSVLTAQILESVSELVSPSLSSPLPVYILSLILYDCLPFFLKK